MTFDEALAKADEALASMKRCSYPANEEKYKAIADRYIRMAEIIRYREAKTRNEG